MNWVEPKIVAAYIEKSAEDFVFLFSGMYPAKKSIIAWDLLEKCTDIEAFKTKLTNNQDKFENAWFGYMGYGLRKLSENYERKQDSIIPLPDFLMMNFKNIMVFDHSQKAITTNSEFEFSDFEFEPKNYKCSELKSNMTDAEYLAKVDDIIQRINNGELYQANLTRKYFGEFNEDPHPYSIFYKLTEISPAPYSAFIKFDGNAIISASPEKFLTVENGLATTKPIKGTLSSNSPAALLSLSEKDRAENLMIVDLMRNDLAKTCKRVRVPKLFEVTSYTKYHHMSSTIIGEPLQPAIEVALGCFPPGSMTGAPKIHAVKLCDELEGIERGVYSGALGYFGGDGSCDLSVVIRTMILNGKKFEFQVGGGIVADSKPLSELEETKTKARPILEAI